MEKEIPEKQKRLNARVKKGFVIFTIIFLLALGVIAVYNVVTFNSLKKHPGYTIGIVTDSWRRKGNSYSCRYRYSVGERTFEHTQGGEYALGDTLLIVYDTTAPGHNIIAEYPHLLSLDRQGRILGLDTMKVAFSGWDYLPGD